MTTLQLEAPITNWDEAIPLGNGLLGGLLWGEAGLLRLSLDRGDLWDERPAPGDPLSRFTYAQLINHVKDKNYDAITDVVDNQAFNQPTPTKLPAGRLEVNFDPSAFVPATFTLDFATATAVVSNTSAQPIAKVFISARHCVALIYLPGPAPLSLRLIAPASVSKLAYPPAQTGADANSSWFLQPAAESDMICVYSTSLCTGSGTLLAATVTYSPVDGVDVLAAARARAAAALAEGYRGLHEAHLAWWNAFWARSSVQLPDLAVQRHYELVQYFYGAASRPDAPPMPLQGIWTADAGELPPWKGDYHHDLNTQMTYMGYQTSGRFDEGRCFLDYMNRLLPVFRDYAKNFLAVSGAGVPAVMTLAGKPLGGWAQYSMSPIHGAWVAHLFYLHWRYTQDEAFLREIAHPWCHEIAQALRALLVPNADGHLALPLSASPESFDNKPRAWMTPSSNYDVACLRMLFLGQQEMAAHLGYTAEAEAAAATAAAIGPFHVSPQGELMLSADEPLYESHRHLATLMGVYPFNLYTVEGNDHDRAIIRASVAQVDKFGPQWWCGYSYTWMAALRARIGDPEAALRHLHIYLEAFVSRNGFHVNGDQTTKDYSSIRDRPFTLEGNFLVAATVHEMLLQSWSPRPGTGEWGTLRLFPAVPATWANASFTDLVAEGAHRVSARREAGRTTWFSITAGPSTPLRLRDSFADRTPQWSHPEFVTREGDDFILSLTPGTTLTASILN
jgi:alpha-L-fucosidase 2